MLMRFAVDLSANGKDATVGGPGAERCLSAKGDCENAARL